MIETNVWKEWLMYTHGAFPNVHENKQERHVLTCDNIRLLKQSKITRDVYNRLQDIIWSPDGENLNMARVIMWGKDKIGWFMRQVNFLKNIKPPQ